MEKKWKKMLDGIENENQENILKEGTKSLALVQTAHFKAVYEQTGDIEIAYKLNTVFMDTITRNFINGGGLDNGEQGK